MTSFKMRGMTDPSSGFRVPSSGFVFAVRVRSREPLTRTQNTNSERRIQNAEPEHRSASRSGLDDRLAGQAERTRLRRVRRQRDLRQITERYVEPLVITAAIDDRRCRHDLGTRGARHLDRLTRRAAGRYDILDDDD